MRRVRGAQALPQRDSVTRARPGRLLGAWWAGSAQHGRRGEATAPVPGGTKLDGLRFLLESPPPYFRSVVNRGNKLRSEVHTRWAASCPHAGTGLGHLHTRETARVSSETPAEAPEGSRGGINSNVQNTKPFFFLKQQKQGSSY